MKKATCLFLTLVMISSIICVFPALADEERDGVTYKTLDYNDILRNPMSNWGVKYIVEGTVLQRFNEENKLTPKYPYICFRIATKGENDNTVVCRIASTLDNTFGVSGIIEGDKVRIYCSCDGKKNYTTVLGSQISTPIFKISSYEDIEIIEPKK